MAVAAMAAQPAEAGVGGCRPLPGVGGCALATQIPVGNGNVVLDALRGAIRAVFLAYLKSLAESGKSLSKGAVRQGGTQTSDGVGGCRPLPGVGGCAL
jgi:hypothetical protein